MANSEERKAQIFSYILVGLMLITVWYMLDLVLLTFIISYIFYQLVRVIKKTCDKRMPFNVREGLILVCVYCLFIALIVFAVTELLPVVIGWAKSLVVLFTSIDLDNIYNEFGPHVQDFLKFIDLKSMINSLGTWLSGLIATYSTSTVGFLINLFISMILSFVILFEKKKISQFGEKLEKSKVSYVYTYMVTFGKNFCATFGKVMLVQLTIALVNSGLSMLALGIMGFPGIPALGLMIFLLGLIPVAGVIISLIPLGIIAIKIGGFMKLIEVIIMICVLHAIEAYILNPKLMSNKTHLPVSFTFIILLVGQHYLGVWGLLIGVPLFIFLMNLLEVDYEPTEQKVKTRK